MKTSSIPKPMPTMIMNSFSDFPQDVQLTIFSFLTPKEIAIFACTSKQYVFVQQNENLWFSMCERKWGKKTLFAKWSKISYKLLYKRIEEFDDLIGIWRLSCPIYGSESSVPQLVLFEWGEFCVLGFKIAPLEKGSYRVVKERFFIGGLDSEGEKLGFIDPDGCFAFSGDFRSLEEGSGLEGGLGSDLVRVDVNFVGRNHIVVEEFSRSAGSSLRGASEEGGEEALGSPVGGILDIGMLDIYQRHANSTSPGGNGSWRRQRRREKERMGRKKWESEHFVRIENCSPTPAHPLQGLWKGICDDMTLAFYLVAYDDIGGIACRRIGNSSGSSAGHTPIFWALSTTLTESPFSAVEEHIYNSRMHVQPLTESEFSYEDLPPSEISDVSRMLNITSNYDLVISDLAAGRSSNSQQVEGRIWQYGNGMFGFGFLWNNYIIDLKHIFQDGFFLDSVGLPTS